MTMRRTLGGGNGHRAVTIIDEHEEMRDLVDQAEEYPTHKMLASDDRWRRERAHTRRRLWSWVQEEV